MGHPSVRDSMKGHSGRPPLLGNPKDILSKARKWAFPSMGAPLLRNIVGRFFLGPSY